MHHLQCETNKTDKKEGGGVGWGEVVEGEMVEHIPILQNRTETGSVDCGRGKQIRASSRNGSKSPAKNMQRAVESTTEEGAGDACK